MFTTSDGGGAFRLQTSTNGVDLTNASTLNIFCVDYLNGTYVPGNVYDATFTSLTSSSVVNGYLPNTRYGRTQSSWNSGTDPLLAINFLNTSIGVIANPTVLDRYRMAALLVMQYQPGNLALNTSINRAIWQMTAVVPPQGESYPWGAPPTDAMTSMLVSMASTQLNIMNNVMSVADRDSFFSRFSIVTQTNPLYLAGQIPSQEFLAITPEPGFLLALGIGVAMLLFVGSRRRAEQL